MKKDKNIKIYRLYSNCLTTIKDYCNIKYFIGSMSTILDLDAEDINDKTALLKISLKSDIENKKSYIDFFEELCKKLKIFGKIIYEDTFEIHIKINTTK